MNFHFEIKNSSLTRAKRRSPKHKVAVVINYFCRNIKKLQLKIAEIKLISSKSTLRIDEAESN